MSGGTNNFPPTTRNWQVENDYGAYAPNSSEWNRRRTPYYRSGSFSFRANPGSIPSSVNDPRRGAPWQSLEDRVLARPFSLAGFPVHSRPPPQIPILGNLTARDFQPANTDFRQSHRHIIQGSPSGLVHRQNIFPAQENNSRLNQDEENAVLNKLKKEIYNPTPRKLARRLNLYYRDEARNLYNEVEKQNENDCMRCAVCLEDFEPKENVMLTPCNHMFHEDCIVPWVKSNAQCPVCRFSLGEKKRETRASDNNIPTAASDDAFAMELMSVIRAMEESFLWNN